MQVEPKSHCFCHQVLCSVICIHRLIQFSKSLLLPHLTKEETKAQRLSNPPRPQLPNASGGFPHRQSGSRVWAPNRTLSVLELAPSLHLLSEPSVQDGPGGASTAAGAWSRPEAEAEITLLSRPHGLQCNSQSGTSCWSATASSVSAEHLQGWPSTQQGVPSLTSGLLSQKLQSSLLPQPQLWLKPLPPVSS